jgi:hypothetical protein
MNISLLNKIYDSKILNIPYWERIQNGIDAQTIPGSKRIDELRDISQSHQNTRERIAFADYHIHNLDQIYIRHTTPRYTETPTWAMAEMHGIISNLYSALDSLSNEINIAYKFNIPTRNCELYHNVQDHKRGKPNKNCIRCNVDQADSMLSKHLNNELGQDWFEHFRSLRHQMTHRMLPVYEIGVSTGDPKIPDNAVYLMIPNNPANNNPQHSDFSKGLDFNDYCHECRVNVVALIEQAYKIIDPRIKAL